MRIWRAFKSAIKVLCMVLSLCIVLYSCNSVSKNDDAQDVPVIDWSENLSTVKLDIAELANVKYIPLETTDSCLIDVITGAAIGDDTIVLTDSKQGCVFIFDDSGRFVGRINRKGSGPEEYPFMSKTAVDFSKKEVYVYSMLGNRVFAYDFNGVFLRKTNIGRPGQFDDFYNYNDSLLIAYDKTNLSLAQSGFNDEPYRYITINKLSGEVRSLPIKIDHPIGNIIKWRKPDVLEAVKIAGRPIMCDGDRFVIADFASDTIFEVKDSHVNILACQKNIDRERDIPDRVNIEAAFGDLLILGYTRIADVSNQGVEFDEETGGTYVYNLKTKELNRLDVKLPYLKKVKNIVIDNSGVQAANTILCRLLYPEMLLKHYEKGDIEGPLLNVLESLDAEANPILMIATFNK